LVGIDAVGAAEQGFSVAVSSNGKTALVGGPNDSGGVGAAWVFTDSSSGWSSGIKLTGGGQAFGYSVALSPDGNTALIGDPSDSGEGAAWIFTSSSNWSQPGIKLTASDAMVGSNLGWSVALAVQVPGTGTALIGGPGNGTGAAWVFTLSGSTWSQQATLQDTTVGAAGQGSSVALSANGSTALIGGPSFNSGDGGAWVWTRSGGTWTEEPGVLAGAPTSGTSPAQQGSSVGLSQNALQAFIGGPGDGNGVGAVWVFAPSGDSWAQQAKLVGSGNSGNSRQGSSIAAILDAVLIGGPGDGGNTGAAWLFNGAGRSWFQLGNKMVGSNSVGNAGQGFSVATASGTPMVMLGGPSDNNGAGAVWTFTIPRLSVTAPLSADDGTPFEITVTAEDTAGAIVTGYTDTLSFTSSDNAASLPANSTLTNGTGQFQVTLRTPGNQTITATDTSLPEFSGNATVNVIGPPTINKIFGFFAGPRTRSAAVNPDGLVPTIPLNGSTNLSFTLTNPNSSCGLCGGITAP
jgi:hypothetical protein